ncbi:hypothetical protein [Amycolatopsis sp. NPDC059021]|uniref:hypothetical protein n=1 Tax=Amycolatopsis sp. NPDC059021 TaxID=3346704 RepID=UPI003672C598
MSRGPALLLSFAWAVPLEKDEAARIFDDGASRGLLAPLSGALHDEWTAAERFLATYSEEPDRRLLCAPGDGEALSIAVGPHPLPCRTVVTWHPAYHAMTFVFTTTVRAPERDAPAADVDLAIALLQSLQGRTALGDQGLYGCYRGEKQPSLLAAVTKAFDELTTSCETDGLRRKGWCVELRGYDGRPPAPVVAADPRPYYGLATSDEGWRFVPREVARDALGPSWGTRSFVAAYAMATGIVCLNSKDDEYIDHQRELAVRRFGEPEPYFGIDSSVAGLDHGMLFVLERVLIRMALADQWLRRAQRAHAEGGDPASRTRLLRGSLDDILEMLNSVLPAEVDSLERRLVTSMGVERIIRQLDRQAQAMDEETRYSYENTVSARVTRLTRVTVLLTVVTIVLGVLQVLVSM